MYTRISIVVSENTRTCSRLGLVLERLADAPFSAHAHAHPARDRSRSRLNYSNTSNGPVGSRARSPRLDFAVSRIDFGTTSLSHRDDPAS